MISAKDVQRLREETGAGVMDAKRALEQAAGDFEKAKDILRQQGFARAAERAEREAGQGVVDAYIHGEGRVGALVELSSESDFVARNPEFRTLAREVAMQVAAMEPNDVEELLAQPYIRDQSKTVRDLITSLIAKTGENIRVSRFAVFRIGRGG